MLQSFPGNDVGGDGDIVFNESTGEVRQMIDGVWTQLTAGTGMTYLIYQALLSQTGTEVPTATILANTLGGEPVWSRVSSGNYEVTLAGAFPSDKCLMFLMTQDTGWWYGGEQSAPDSLYLTTTDRSAFPSDDKLFKSSFQILVFH